jgi:DNA-binding NarL/FixJ family response regulator
MTADGERRMDDERGTVRARAKGSWDQSPVDPGPRGGDHPEVIRVCIVDDHARIRAGLERLLGATEDLCVVGSAPNGRVALDVVARARPDVVVMDLSMPELDGVAATRAIVADAPGTRVVVLTAVRDRRRTTAALEAGAVACLLKDADPAELIGTIRAAASG